MLSRCLALLLLVCLAALPFGCRGERPNLIERSELTIVNRTGETVQVHSSPMCGDLLGQPVEDQWGALRPGALVRISAEHDGELTDEPCVRITNAAGTMELTAPYKRKGLYLVSGQGDQLEFAVVSTDSANRSSFYNPTPGERGSRPVWVFLIPAVALGVGTIVAGITAVRYYRLRVKSEAAQR